MNIARIFSIDPVQDGRDQEGVADLKNNKPLVNPKNEQEKGVREIGTEKPTEKPLRNPKNESGLRVAYPKNEQENGVREIGTNLPTNPPLTYPQKYILTSEFSNLVGCNLSRAQEIFKNGKYKGALLDIKTVQTNTGRGGKTYRLHVDSLPHDLRARYYLQFGIDIDARKVAGITASIANLEHEYGVDPSYDNARADAIWRKTIIDPILKAPARSKERTETIGRISREGVIGQDGLHQSITKVTLYGWVKKYEASGLHGLIRKKRNDAKRRRVIVNKKYDAFFLPYIGDDHLQCVSQEIRHYIRGLWAAGSTGWRAVSEQSATKLIEISSLLDVPEFNVLEKGRASDGAKALTQFGICHISRRMAEQERRYRLLAIKNKDNARLQDKYAATIKRDYRV